MARADVELVARGLAPSRASAQRLIADGAVWLAPSHGAAPESARRVERPSQPIGAFDALHVAASDETRFVSRAGAKLDHALRESGVELRDHVVLDLGMSTGGFTDCALAAGAVRVVGIEVGHGQLHPRLRADARVTCVERLNLRDATPARLAALGGAPPAGGFARAVADLSFISLVKVLPAIDALLAPDAQALLLVKPQFELEPAALDGRGVVADACDRRRALESVAAACRARGWSVRRTFDSALPGGDGNRESFLHACVPAVRDADPSRHES